MSRVNKWIPSRFAPVETGTLKTSMAFADSPRGLPAAAAVHVIFAWVSHPSRPVSVLVTPPAQTSAKSIRANHDASTEKRFARLSRQWVEETAGRSTIREKAIHPSYQAIIGMGSVAIPHILHELSRSPNHWFWALHMITGEDPVPAEDRGDLKRMSKAWIEWGRAHNLIQS